MGTELDFSTKALPDLCPPQTLSQLAGSDDDTQALINLSPADLAFMDTNALCDKFKTSIMQIMGTRG